MPYSDPIKKKKYYHRTQKPYIDKWRKESSWWNDYQKNYRKTKRWDHINQILAEGHDFAVDIHLIEDKGEIKAERSDEEVYMAFMIFWLSAHTGKFQTQTLAHYLKYESRFVGDVKRRYVKYGYLTSDKLWILDFDTNDYHQLSVGFALMGLVGAGKLARVVME
jgi:hypothetical protein